MAEKNVKIFKFKNLAGEEIAVRCCVYTYSGGWGHRASLIYINNDYYDFKTRKTYYNRTREAFEFESVLYQLFSKFYNHAKDKNDLNFIRLQLKEIAKNEEEKADAWFNGWLKTFNALSDKTKEKIKSMDLMLESTDQADCLLKTACMMEALQ